MKEPLDWRKVVDYAAQQVSAPHRNPRPTDDAMSGPARTTVPMLTDPQIGADSPSERLHQRYVTHLMV